MLNIRYLLTILTYFVVIRLVCYALVWGFTYNYFTLLILLFMLYRSFFYILFGTNIIDIITLRINYIINKPLYFIIVYTTRFILIGFYICVLMKILLVFDIPLINLCLSFLCYSPLYFITSNLIHPWLYIGTGGSGAGGSSAGGGPSAGGPSGGPSGGGPGGGPNRPNNMLSGVNNPDSTRHNDSRSRSATPIETDPEYWQYQCKIFYDGLSSLDKSDNDLTSDEAFAKKELTRLKMYNQEEMTEAFLENLRNRDYPTDPESIRALELLNRVSRSAEMHRESYVHRQEMIRRGEAAAREAQLREQAKIAESIAKENSVITDCLKKLRSIAEYNRDNNTSIPANSHVPGELETKLSKEENELLAKIITNDPHAPLDVRSKIINRGIHGNIGVNSVLFDYLENKKK